MIDVDFFIDLLHRWWCRSSSTRRRNCALRSSPNGLTWLSGTGNIVRKKKNFWRTVSNRTASSSALSQSTPNQIGSLRTRRNHKTFRAFLATRIAAAHAKATIQFTYRPLVSIRPTWSHDQAWRYRKHPIELVHFHLCFWAVGCTFIWHIGVRLDASCHLREFSPSPQMSLLCQEHLWYYYIGQYWPTEDPSKFQWCSLCLCVCVTLHAYRIFWWGCCAHRPVCGMVEAVLWGILLWAGSEDSATYHSTIHWMYIQGQQLYPQPAAPCRWASFQCYIYDNYTWFCALFVLCSAISASSHVRSTKNLVYVTRESSFNRSITFPV